MKKTLISLIVIILLSGCADKIYTHQHNKGSKNLTQKNFSKHYKKQIGT